MSDMTLFSLPNELVVEILRWCDYRSITRFSGTCNKFLPFRDDDYLRGLIRPSIFDMLDGSPYPLHPSPIKLYAFVSQCRHLTRRYHSSEMRAKINFMNISEQAIINVCQDVAYGIKESCKGDTNHLAHTIVTCIIRMSGGSIVNMSKKMLTEFHSQRECRRIQKTNRDMFTISNYNYYGFQHIYPALIRTIDDTLLSINYREHREDMMMEDIVMGMESYTDDKYEYKIIAWTALTVFLNVYFNMNTINTNLTDDHLQPNPFQPHVRFESDSEIINFMQWFLEMME